MFVLFGATNFCYFLRIPVLKHESLTHKTNSCWFMWHEFLPRNMNSHYVTRIFTMKRKFSLRNADSHYITRILILQREFSQCDMNSHVSQTIITHYTNYHNVTRTLITAWTADSHSSTSRSRTAPKYVGPPFACEETPVWLTLPDGSLEPRTPHNLRVPRRSYGIDQGLQRSDGGCSRWFKGPCISASRSAPFLMIARIAPCYDTPNCARIHRWTEISHIVQIHILRSNNVFYDIIYPQ